MLAELEPLAMSSTGYVVAIALGLLWGSFANVCIYRWPAGGSVVAPGSHCSACKAPIRWYDNVPIASYLWLRGQCRACRAAFSPRYLLVEAVTGALFGAAWWMAVQAPAMLEPFDARLLHFVVYAAFCFAMVVITFIDIDHMLILNKITIPSIPLAYLASFAWSNRHWYDGIVGAAVGYGLPWLIGEIYYRITGREGLGLGDGMLLAVVGALLGWPGVLVSLFGGSMIGAVVGIAAVLIGRSRGEADDDTDDDATASAPAKAAPAEAKAAAMAAATSADTQIPPAVAAADPASPAGPAPGGEAEKPSVMRTELPFGPFLAMAAVLYLFAEPWIDIHFHLPGG